MILELVELWGAKPLLRGDIALVVERDIHRPAIAHGAGVPEPLGILDQARDPGISGLFDPRPGFIPGVGVLALGEGAWPHLAG